MKTKKKKRGSMGKIVKNLDEREKHCFI